MLKMVIEEKRKFRLPHWDYKECVWLERSGFLETFVLTNESYRLQNDEIQGCVAIPYIPNRFELMSPEWVEVE